MSLNRTEKFRVWFIGFNNKQRRATAYRIFVKSLVASLPIIIPSIITALFTFSLYFFGTKSDLLIQRKYDHQKYILDSKKEVIDEFSRLTNSRYLYSRRLINTPCNSASINSAWTNYDTAVLEWNESLDILTSKFNIAFGERNAAIILDGVEDVSAKFPPESLHYKFTSVHSILVEYKDCKSSTRDIGNARIVLDSIAVQKKNIILNAYQSIDNGYKDIKALTFE